MNKRFVLAATAAFVVACLQFGYSQSKTTNKLLPPPANIAVDGNLSEWGDSLRYYNEEKKLNYSLANDSSTLYMAIRIVDKSEQMRAMFAGITLSIDTRGKKKETFTMTFPVGGQMDMPKPLSPDQNAMAAPDQDELMRARLTKLRNIKLTGFKDIESDDVITTSNTYGFKAAINYDANGELVYEAAIPLRFFHAEDQLTNEWAFNFKINGIIKANSSKGFGEEGTGFGSGSRGGMGGGGRGGMGGGGRGRERRRQPQLRFGKRRNEQINRFLGKVLPG